MGFDVLTLGETMLRLTPRGFDRLEQATNVELHVGGSESNTAVGIARLGHQVAWLSRMTNNPIGHALANAIRAHGVDVSHIVWTAEDRVGTYYMERGQPPRESQVIYDRKHSAASRMTPDDLPGELFRADSLRWLHTTGITVGISASAAATAMRAAELTKQAGGRVSFDLNYRSRLWSPEDAKHGCEDLLHMADLIFMPDRDARTVCQVDLPDPEQTLEELGAAYPQATIVLTLGSRGAAARNSGGQYWYQPAFEAIAVERLGGGDAFAAGFLVGMLEDNEVGRALRWGAAVAALKYTTPGDLPIIDRLQVEKLLAGETDRGIAR